MLKINGVTIVTPKGYELSISDIDGETNRNANGTLIRDRIAVKRKLNLDWQPLTQNQSSTLLNAVTSVFFDVTFVDPKDGIITKTMYVGDRSTPAYSYINGVVLWNGLKMNFIER